MAVMTLDSRMVYWKIRIRAGLSPWLDITEGIRHFVNSIKVTKGIALPKKNSKKKQHAPAILEIVMNEGGYTEGVFTEGVEVQLFMGYDKLLPPLVFEGVIELLPSGGSREMLSYTVVAHSRKTSSVSKERVKTFKGKTKSDIVAELAAEMGLDYFTSIEKDRTFPAGFSPIQKGQTDIEMLDKFASEWACTWWIRENTLYFVDETEAYELGNFVGSIHGGTYLLGYRTDKFGVENNVESVDWAHNPSPGGSTTQSIMRSFDEDGEDLFGKVPKIIEQGETWQMQDRYLQEYKINPSKFGGYVLHSTGQTFALEGQALLREFFKQTKGRDDISNEEVPEGGGAGTGVEITIRLNEGDPLLEPPRSARLYAGSSVPRMYGNLPKWLFKSKTYPGAAELKINETVLIYESGLLKSELKCGIMGMLYASGRKPTPSLNNSRNSKYSKSPK